MSAQATVIACYDDVGGWQGHLERQLRDRGVPYIWEKLKTFTWAERIRWERGIAAAHPNDNIVVVDPWDMLFVGTKNELDDLASRHQLLFHSERNCWPDASLAEKHPRCSTPYRYVNGVIAGRGSVIRDAIDYGLQRFPLLVESKSHGDVNTNSFYMRLFLDGWGSLDYNCEMWMTLCGFRPEHASCVDGRIVNHITGTKPLFIHANGASKHYFKHLMDDLARR